MPLYPGGGQRPLLGAEPVVLAEADDLGAAVAQLDPADGFQGGSAHARELASLHALQDVRPVAGDPGREVVSTVAAALNDAVGTNRPLLFCRHRPGSVEEGLWLRSSFFGRPPGRTLTHQG